jgi:hypothetical protein
MSDLAICLERVEGGIRVLYRDGVESSKDNPVRVLMRRAHTAGGTASEFPQPGELGLVERVDEGLAIWLGSLPEQEANQIPLELNMAYWRHESGLRRWTAQNGDVAFDHPSGLKLWATIEDGPPARPETSASPTEVKTDPVQVGLDHPSGVKVRIEADGRVRLEALGGALLTVDAEGKVALQGAEVMFQDASARFVMEALVDWVKTHTHSGVQTGGGVSGAPSSQPPASSLSPSTFKGPHA